MVGRAMLARSAALRHPLCPLCSSTTAHTYALDLDCIRYARDPRPEMAPRNTVSTALVEDWVGQRRQAQPLFSLLVEVGGIKPAHECSFQLRPILVDRRVPRGVAIAPLTIRAWRKMPSNDNPRRCAAVRDGALSALHFHS